MLGYTMVETLLVKTPTKAEKIFIGIYFIIRKTFTYPFTNLLTTRLFPQSITNKYTPGGKYKTGCTCNNKSAPDNW